MGEALLGGALIGLASLLLMAFNGRICGVSGIVGTLPFASKGDRAWRLAFLAGLVGGGFVLWNAQEAYFQNTLVRSPAALVVAGLLVGFGTRLGSGCTSGHGVCGVSRLSPRSLVATAVFMGAGIGMVALVRALVGGSL